MAHRVTQVDRHGRESNPVQQVYQDLRSRMNKQGKTLGLYLLKTHTHLNTPIVATCLKSSQSNTEKMGTSSSKTKGTKYDRNSKQAAPRTVINDVKDKGKSFVKKRYPGPNRASLDGQLP